MTKTKKISKTVLRILILALPYLIYIIRMLIQILDEYSQHKVGQLLDKLNLIPEQQPIQEPQVKI